MRRRQGQTLHPQIHHGSGQEMQSAFFIEIAFCSCFFFFFFFFFFHLFFFYIFFLFFFFLPYLLSNSRLQLQQLMFLLLVFVVVAAVAYVDIDDSITKQDLTPQLTFRLAPRIPLFSRNRRTAGTPTPTIIFLLILTILLPMISLLSLVSVFFSCVKWNYC